ncbi:MAG: DNA-3-methyladenine glycosylase family protein [Hyphomicrobiaceae bacterium]
MSPDKQTTGLIRTRADIEQGVSALRRKCQYIRHVHDTVGNPPLRRSRRGFPGLARIIVGQQLSTASAKAIWSRVEAGITPMTPRQLLRVDDKGLAALGLSRPKIRSLRALANAVTSGDLNLGSNHHKMPEHQLRELLLQVSGIGPWSVDIYLLFCLGYRDAFAPGDLALQIAVENIFELPERPKPDELAALAKRWSPWQGIAARLLWAYYENQKNTATSLK